MAGPICPNSGGRDEYAKVDADSPGKLARLHVTGWAEEVCLLIIPVQKGKVASFPSGISDFTQGSPQQGSKALLGVRTVVLFFQMFH
jgi:hypothetical protein